MLGLLDRRTLLFAGGALIGLSRPTLAAEAFNAVLSTRPNDPRGEATYDTLKAAVAAAPADGERPFRILVTAGAWREQAEIDKPNVHLIGEGRGQSIIVFNQHAAARRGGEIATLTVTAPGFRARRLTIANDFDYPGNMPADVPYDRTGASGAQALALRLGQGSDKAWLDDVALTGWQDTLYAEAGRSLYTDCLISGCVDFIYGAGVAVFERCEIRSRTRPGKDFHGFIAAPNTNRNQTYGLVFLDCRLTRDADMPDHTMALGRPWRATKAFADGRYGDPDAVGHAAFIRCWMDRHIVPEGWYPMHYNLRSGRRTMYQPDDARLFEFASRGPGAGRASKIRRMLSTREARLYQRATLLDGWSPN